MERHVMASLSQFFPDTEHDGNYGSLIISYMCKIVEKKMNRGAEKIDYDR